MSTVTERLLTAEEFARLPEPRDGSRQELVRGRIITMPPPGFQHGKCCVKVVRRVATFVDDHNLGDVTSNDAGFVTERAPDSVRGPDIGFWKKGQVPADCTGYPEIPPDLAIEVVSPSDTHTRVQEKLRQYFRSGVPRVWLVDPELRIVTVYRGLDQLRTLEENDKLSDEILPGFECKVSDLLP